jgi:hypothetical protein
LSLIRAGPPARLLAGVLAMYAALAALAAEQPVMRCCPHHEDCGEMRIQSC